MSKLVEKLRELLAIPTGLMAQPIDWDSVDLELSRSDAETLLAEAERLEAKASNWRIGMAVTPKLKSHRFYGCIGVVREIIDGDNLVIEAWGQFASHKITQPADDWKAA